MYPPIYKYGPIWLNSPLAHLDPFLSLLPKPQKSQLVVKLNHQHFWVWLLTAHAVTFMMNMSLGKTHHPSCKTENWASKGHLLSRILTSNMTSTSVHTHHTCHTTASITNSAWSHANWAWESIRKNISFQFQMLAKSLIKKKSTLGEYD